MEVVAGTLSGWVCYGNGYDNGYGDGNGYGYGTGTGDGYGYGTGDGTGYGTGDGYGYGYGTGTGSGDGYGTGDGYGSGYGDVINCSPIKVSVTDLTRAGACASVVQEFSRSFPGGAEWPRDIDAARAAGLDVKWAVQNLGLMRPRSPRDERS